MRRMALLLVPAALFGGQARYARLGDFDGKVEVQLQAADNWTAAQRNLPLIESARVRTGEASRLEIELDDGGALRLGPDSLAELSDYSRLSTGQRVTLLSMDRGIGYYTGQADGTDALTLALPGAQVILRRGARIRLDANDTWSQVAVIEGSVKFSSPAAEFDLNEGQTARVEPAHRSRFFLYREVAANDLDRWNEERDKALSSPAAAQHVPVAYGLADLDSAGEWVQTDTLGAVWKPKVAEGWVPYRNGQWQWYDTLGYTWVAAEPWGWTPYHHGRWARHDTQGWVWAPAKTNVFKPGEVYWLRGAKIAGWGPLAPGEEWLPTAAPRQFLNVHTTWAAFQQEAKVIDPAGFDARPKEPLGVAAFTLALPSPSLAAARLDAARPALRASGVRVAPLVPGVAYETANAPGSENRGVPGAAPGTPAAPVAVVTNPAAPETPVVVIQNPPPPPPPSTEVLYPVPVYTGIVVVNPPENDDHDHRRRRGGNPPPQPRPQPTPPPGATPPQPPVKSVLPHGSDSDRERPHRVATPPATPPAQERPARSEPSHQHQDRPAPPPAPAQPAVPRGDAARERHERPAQPAPAPPAEKKADDQPVKRGDDRPATRRGQ